MMYHSSYFPAFNLDWCQQVAQDQCRLTPMVSDIVIDELPGDTK
jgi:hypothetical protein